MIHRPTATGLVLALSALGTTPLVAQHACDEARRCDEVSSFRADVSDFRESVSGNWRLVTTTIRFQNKTAGPLILGYVTGSGLVIDDQGNRYEVRAGGGIRGIGEIAGTTYDPKFVLQPGEASDARIEFAWQPARGVIYGTRYEMDLTIREIEPITGNQHKLGREHALHFAGFGEVPAGGAGGGVASAPADPCGGDTRCNHAGPFVAQVIRLTQSKTGPYNDITLEATVKFTNLTAVPLILGYSSGTNSMVDDVGNRYYWGRAGTHDKSVAGMGLVTSRAADPSFQLRPGESRNATFKVWFRSGRKVVGTRYAFDFSAVELEVLPSRQIRTVREYAVGFRDLTTGTWGGSGLLDGLVKSILKP